MTTFPIPVVDDDAPHVYVSVGHQQMMTDPMKPLGLSLWQLLAIPVMHEAAGRLFVDVAPRLASPVTRTAVIEALGKGDPLIGDALQTIVDRGFVPEVSDGPTPPPPAGAGPPATLDADAAIVARLIADSEAALETAKRDIRGRFGPEVFAAIRADVLKLKGWLVDPLNREAIMAGMEANWWLNDKLEEWLGEINAADTLSLSVPNNVTSEMGLELLDVADVIRPFPPVVALLESGGEDFLDTLAAVDGGAQAAAAIQAYLDKYGMRCVGEIDITRPRWAEHPSSLLPLLLGNVKNAAPGEGGRRFEQGRREAAEKERDVLERLQTLPGGDDKASETKRMIERVRTFAGYREYPKYRIVSRSFVWKERLLEEAARLGIGEDAFYLTFDELEDAARTGVVDHDLIAARRRAFESYGALTPPRVLTSDGEAIGGSYGRDVPTGALVGLAVSTGTVEGRARVLLDVADADCVEPGDILVTAFTDPSWSPLFVAVAGLVTEVGGLMTHGAVIAREYGLPAVVGVEHATRLIADGRRIRVHGTEGYVELL